MSNISSISSKLASLRSATVRKQSRALALAPPCHISLLLYSNSGEVPVAGEAYQVVISPVRTESGTTDDEGRVAIESVPAGDYLMELTDHEIVFAVSAVPTDVEDVPRRVPGYMPGGHDDLPEHDDTDADSDTDSGPTADADEAAAHMTYPRQASGGASSSSSSSSSAGSSSAESSSDTSDDADHDDSVETGEGGHG